MTVPIRNVALGLAMLAFAVCGPARSAPAPDASTLHVTSSVRGLNFIALRDLPKAPAPVEGLSFCRDCVAEPVSDAGRLVASRGWAVTGEVRMGQWQVVSFAARFGEGTSGSFSVEQGNVGIFDGAALVALAYAPKASDRTIGTITSLEGGNVRVWDGDFLSLPIADIHAADQDLVLGRLAPEEMRCNGQAVVPNIYSMPINQARDALARKGWTPVPGRFGTNEVEFSREIDLAKRGIAEVDGCSGTGFGYCSYNYRSVAGTLSVTTVGDDSYPSVSNYDVQCR